MTKRIKLVAAIVMAFAAQSALADLDFGGYLRSGSGSSSKGGGFNCFRVNATSVFNTEGNSDAVDAAGRLGNQCDTYGEVKLGATMGDSDGTKFGVHTLVAYGTSQVTDYEGTIPALRESYGSATGFGSGAFAQSTAWVGKRFYKREDVHIVDLFIMQDVGPGAGLENINVGFGKFSYAWMRSGIQNYQDVTPAGTPGQEVGRVTLNGNPAAQKSDHDLRLEGINLGNAGSLGFGTNIVLGENAAVPGNNENGWMAWGKHSIVMFGTWQNSLWLQIAHGGANLDGSALWWAQSNGGNGQPGSFYHSGWRVIDAANFDWSDKWNAALFWGYGKQTFPWQGTGSWVGSMGNEQTTWSIVARPIYHFTENLGLAVEAGTTRVSGYNLNGDNNPNNTTNYLNKLTISPQLSMGSGFYARPILRAYVSFMNWNRDTTPYGIESGARECTGRDCSVAVPGIFASGSNAITYGVQMEAWW